MSEKIRVLVIDDSAVVRQTLTQVLESDPDIRVIAAAADPYIAAQRMRVEAPDVITLDVEMPRMDGLTFLRKLMNQHPIPVVMCSSLTETGAETAIRALEYGAVDIITKPKVGVQKFLEESKILICDAVKAAAQTHPRRRRPTKELKAAPKLSADAVIAKPRTGAMIQTTEKVVVIGASTGGTEALKLLLERLPRDVPGTVIVQHMPERFTASFAKRLNELVTVNVKEAQDNDGVIPGRVLIAPGNRHTLLRRSGARYYVNVKDGPLVSRHRPSVDVLFRSAAQAAGRNAIAVIMTGMGDDGAKGMLELRESGARTMAQDEESCVVYGMPKEAVMLGGVEKIAHLNRLAPLIVDWAGQ